MVEVIWTSRAQRQLEKIAEYLASSSELYTAIVVRKILDSTRSLNNFPLMGHPVPEDENSNIRELFAYEYRILYTFELETVRVIAVIHGRRLLDMEDFR